MATFTKLPSGSWRVQVRRKGRYVSETFLRRDDARLWATDAERQIDRGETPSESRICASRAAANSSTFISTTCAMSASPSSLESCNAGNLVAGTYAGPFMLHLNAALAEKERRLISDRTRVALTSRNGSWHNARQSHQPIAATAKGQAESLREADRFAATVLPIVRSIQQSGIAILRGIAIALNNRGVRTARGGK